MSHPWANDKMPGGNSFQDITHILTLASQAIGLGEIVARSTFTLNDAMNAIEIMDPRMDSGVILPQSSLDSGGEAHMTFDPLTPLLPVEVCWVIDRSMAGEMGWHGGSTLSQTVYTLLYVHHLNRLQPDKMLPTGDITRPVELISVVLRSAVVGLLKTCDLVWRELIKGHVYDGEDFHSDKFDVSLCEGFQVAKVVELLDDGLRWLSAQTPNEWYEALKYRLELRKCLLLAISQSPDIFGTQEALVYQAHRLLQMIVKSTPPPPFNSPAGSAFDPTITRRLVSVAPLKAIELISQEDAWKALQGMLDGMIEAYGMRDCESPLKFMSALEARSRNLGSSAPMRNAFVRSMNSTILSYKHPRWILGLVYSEITFIPHEYMSSLARTASHFLLQSGHLVHQPALISDSLTDIENRIKELLVFLASALNQNRSRARRTFAKMLFAWHKLDEDVQGLVGLLQQPPGTSQVAVNITSRLPLAILHIRLSIVIELMFSGFELDLYTPSEFAFTYWYLSSILGTQVKAISALLSLCGSSEMEETSMAYLESRQSLVTALRLLSLTRLSMLIRKAKKEELFPKLDPDRQRMNIERRLDWILPGEGESTDLSDVAKPDWVAYEIEMIRLKRREDEEAVSKDMVWLSQGRSLLLGLKENSMADESMELCSDIHKQFINRLIETSNFYLTICQKEKDAMETHTAIIGEDETHQESRGSFAFSTHVWFPWVD
ncbi:hypothetical protein FRC03_008889 [Tulasnella sp. 419]|nr:hypothetical protein FRC03_008889 [Tulasnella sp. 419]